MSLARRLHRTIALTAGLGLALFLLGLLGPGAALAAPAGDGSSIVRFQDYTLPQGQTVQSVVVIHGNAVIGGTVRHSVVVVDGDATIESTAVVGAAETAGTSSVVVVGGHLTIVPGAAVHGKTTQVTTFHLGGLLGPSSRGSPSDRSAWSWAGGSSSSCRSSPSSCRRCSLARCDESRSGSTSGSGRRSAGAWWAWSSPCSSSSSSRSPSSGSSWPCRSA